MRTVLLPAYIDYTCSGSKNGNAPASSGSRLLAGTLTALRNKQLRKAGVAAPTPLHTTSRCPCLTARIGKKHNGSYAQFMKPGTQYEVYMAWCERYLHPKQLHMCTCCLLPLTTPLYSLATASACIPGLAQPSAAGNPNFRPACSALLCHTLHCFMPGMSGYALILLCQGWHGRHMQRINAPQCQHDPWPRRSAIIHKQMNCLVLFQHH